MTKSYIVDPETGKLLTAQEWKEKAGDNVRSAKMVAIVPEDGTPFAFPVEVFDACEWAAALGLGEGYKAPHVIDGSDGTFTLPSRKQGLDIRMARECGLDQLLEMIGADALLRQLRHELTWTREKYVPAGTSEDRWSSVRNSATNAWYFNNGGFCYNSYVRYALAARPVTLLKL